LRANTADETGVNNAGSDFCIACYDDNGVAIDYEVFKIIRSTQEVLIQGSPPVRRADIFQTLWSGSWSSGTISVPNFDKYNIFLVGMEGQGTEILAIKRATGTYLRGVGGYTSDAPVPMSYFFAATYSGTNLAWVACNSITHLDGGAHGAITARTVNLIRGVV
jgi:hypothetical protein